MENCERLLSFSNRSYVESGYLEEKILIRLLFIVAFLENLGLILGAKGASNCAALQPESPVILNPRF